MSRHEACTIWPGTSTARHGRKRAQADLKHEHAMLGPDRKPVERARHDPIRLRPAKHDSRPMWPVEHEHDPALHVRSDSSWLLTHADPTAQNSHVECIKSPNTRTLPRYSPTPALRSPPRCVHTSLPTVPLLLDLAATPHPRRLTQFLCHAPRRVVAAHHVESSLPLHSTRRLRTCTSWSWPVLEDPSTTIFDTVALFPMTTMAIEMVVPARS
jgi:hypothetical protein